MSSLQSLREFISERLAAAAEEIFRHCEGTIVQYEQELCRQRRLLDLRKPQLQLNAIVLSQYDASEKEDLYNNQGISIEQQDELELPQIEEQQKEPELQQIKEEQEELESTQIVEKQRGREPRPIKEEHREPEPPQMKEEQEGLCIIQVEEQLGLKQETDTLMETPTYEEKEYREANLNNRQRFNATDSEDEEGNQHKESTSTTDGQTDPENIDQRKRGDSIFYIMPSEGTKKANNESVSMRTETDDRPYICEECGKTFNYVSRFRIHMRTHTGEKPFSCKECDKSFRENSNLIRHVRTHTGEKPFSCKECNTSFNQKSSLTRHMRTHTGEKPFSCKYCDRSFCDKSLLKRHIRTHTGERPFSCNECDKSFSHISNLKVHMRTHTGERPFSCKECDTSFRQMSYLKRHMMTHTGEMPFACQKM